MDGMRWVPERQVEWEEWRTRCGKVGNPQKNQRVEKRRSQSHFLQGEEMRWTWLLFELLESLED